MARAKANFEVVTTYEVKRVEKKTSVRKFKLELSEDEALTLLVILGHVGGPTGAFGKTSARRHSAAITDALYGAGLNYEDEDRYGRAHPVSSEMDGTEDHPSIYFLPDKSEEDRA